MRVLVPLLALALVGCAEGHLGPVPPKRYQGDGAFLVRTRPTGDMPAVCRGASTTGESVGLDGRGTILACAGPMAAVVPNPCEWRDDPYAQILCHEFAHLLGWPGDHPRE